MIRFNCHDCGKKFKVEERHAGKSSKCVDCGASLIVPATSPEPIADGKVRATSAMTSPQDANKPNLGDSVNAKILAISTFAQRTLLPNEVLICSARMHKVIFLAPAVVFGCVSLAFLIAAITARNEYQFMLPLIFLIFLLSALIVSKAVIQYLTTECVLTDKRVLGKTGLLRRHSLELLLTKVEGLSIDQGLMGRFFDFGSVVVSGTGGSKTPFDGISQPLEFRRRVQEQIAVVQDSG
jgi:DNA-directed RNA polymerase subunit RPC12/RpoP